MSHPERQQDNIKDAHDVRFERAAMRSFKKAAL